MTSSFSITCYYTNCRIEKTIGAQISVLPSSLYLVLEKKCVKFIIIEYFPINDFYIDFTALYLKGILGKSKYRTVSQRKCWDRAMKVCLDQSTGVFLKEI